MKGALQERGSARSLVQGHRLLRFFVDTIGSETHVLQHATIGVLRTLGNRRHTRKIFTNVVSVKFVPKPSDTRTSMIGIHYALLCYQTRNTSNKNKAPSSDVSGSARTEFELVLKQ